MKEKLILTHKTIRIRRSIQTDFNLREFIFKNSNYRRKVWNDFVEAYFNSTKSTNIFNIYDYKSKYYNEVEKPNNIYNEYCTGISEQVMKDFKCALKMIKSNHGKLHFKKFNKFYCSFGVHTKSEIKSSSKLLNTPRLYSRVHIIDDMHISFRENRDKTHYITLREPLFENILAVDNIYYFYDKNEHYYFSEEDIKEISFIHELGKFYISLSINVIYINKVNNSRKKKAGIDLGIHNPLMVYDGKNNISFKMSQKKLNRIHYLERRIKRLQSIMDKKYSINKKLGINPYSKNYYRILKKIRIAWYKIRNIRLDWRRKLSKYIATHYKKIIVDSFKTPDESSHTEIPRSLVKKINRYNRMHGMFLFNESLIHASSKYNCNYIRAPKNTTCTCSYCGHINPHLPLSQRIFKCDKCGYETDRDINAAQNCYASV